MNFSRIIFRVFLAFFALFVIGRVIYRFVFKHDLTFFEEQELRTPNESTSPHQTPMSFDFKKLIKLLDTSAHIKHKATPSFDGNIKPFLDRSIVEQLLKELLQERVKLRNYILDLKGYSTMGVPIRKYRSLLYYLEILENNIADMKTLLKKEELFKKT